MPKYQEENYTKKEMIKIKKFIFSNIIKNKIINLKTSKTKIIIFGYIFNESISFFFLLNFFL